MKLAGRILKYEVLSVAHTLPLCSKLSRSEIGQFIGEFYQVQLMVAPRASHSPDSLVAMVPYAAVTLPVPGPDPQEVHDHPATRGSGGER